MSKLSLELDVLIEDMERYHEQEINLPRYRCHCNRSSNLFYKQGCSVCNNKGSLSYSRALKVWGILPLSLQVPQCHICTRFETENNPLFAYSYLEKNGEYKFIYRCRKGHDHDHGLILFDIHTGLEVYL